MNQTSSSHWHNWTDSATSNQEYLLHVKRGGVMIYLDRRSTWLGGLPLFNSLNPASPLKKLKKIILQGLGEMPLFLF
jgi:hypothetical protein